MQPISDSVGFNAKNKASDVALVQAILLKSKTPPDSAKPNAPYLTSYDGQWGDASKKALAAFQTDYVFVSADGKQCATNPDATAAIVQVGDATWTKLTQKVDPAFADMRVMDGGKAVYVAATQDDLNARLSAVQGFTFAPVFRGKVIACINRMFELYGIAIGVCRQGDRRTFQEQYDLLVSGRGVTHAGPGESNHNFGMAVDLGFAGLPWLKSDGDVTQNETSWFHILNPDQNVIGPEATAFWQALRAVGTSSAVGAFRGPEGDRPHLQNWNDAGVDMADRLADLMTRVGTMKWRGARQAYSCDLGLGGDYYAVGSARQIWNWQATVTVDLITRARAAQAARAGQRMAMPVGARGVQGAQAPPPVTQADVVQMQQAMRGDFALADRNWTAWTAG